MCCRLSNFGRANADRWIPRCEHRESPRLEALLRMSSTLQWFSPILARRLSRRLKRGAVELLTPRMEQAAAEALADKLAGGYWTHDYALTATEARALGLPVKVGMPQEVLALMKLYPQPVQQTGIEYLPIDIPRQRRV